MSAAANRPDGDPAKYHEEEREFLRDNDSLYTLPLKYIPFHTPALRRGRMVKTFSLVSAIELFKSGDHGRGIILVDDLARNPSNYLAKIDHDGDKHPDQILIEILSGLHSYDVYNLRINLRDYDIPYEGSDYLKLSDEMIRELSVYMQQFTQPLTEIVYGERAAEVFSKNDVTGIFKHPDSAEARENLQRLSVKLGVRISGIPEFLEAFADVYLAVSYYKHYADRIAVMNSLIMQEFDQIHKSLKWQSDPDIERICIETREIVRSLFIEVYQRLDVFERETKSFWNDLNANRFRDMQWLVRDSQKMIAGVLCGLGVKLARWRDRFPTVEHGSSSVRYAALQNEFRPGLKKLLQLAAADMSADEELENRRMAGA